MKVNPGHIEEIRALITTGDVDLAERRKEFERRVGRATSLDDEKLITAIAATDDDDDELFVKNVMEVEGETV